MKKVRQIFLSLIVVALCAFPGNITNADDGIAESAEKVRPIGVGSIVPNASVRDISGNQVELSAILNGKPTILIFYRGGWCPYCNRHLGELSFYEYELNLLGYQIVAVSPDLPEKLKKSIAKNEVKYILLSDSKMALTKAFGLAFKVDDQTVKTYRESYNIDLERDSGETHHLLPVPAAFVVDAKGIIRYRYYNANYKSRVNPRELIKAAEQAKK